MNSLFLFHQNFTSFLRVTSLVWSDLSIPVRVFNDIFYCILQEERSRVTCWNSENSYSHTWRGKYFQCGLNFKFLQVKTAVWKRHCERIFYSDLLLERKLCNKWCKIVARAYSGSFLILIIRMMSYCDNKNNS